ncbi:hypothetical protein P7F60_00055 [Rhizobium sp. YJ-22]|uniref:hypothetical protein n=1 Tax=Rhizobiaceae TaxID=82115 RepID=UPI0012E3B57C|nr:MULTISPECIES: hypothetical protein [Rhizobiaceae]MDG3574762.1 hypothetical protein [Rhizobium sp. YJ-22]
MAQGKIISVSPYGPEVPRPDEKVVPAASPPKPSKVKNTSLGAFKRWDEKRTQKAEAKAAKYANKIAEGKKPKGWKDSLQAERWRNALNFDLGDDGPKDQS